MSDMYIYINIVKLQICLAMYAANVNTKINVLVITTVRATLLKLSALRRTDWKTIS